MSYRHIERVKQNKRAEGCGRHLRAILTTTRRYLFPLNKLSSQIIASWEKETPKRGVGECNCLVVRFTSVCDRIVRSSDRIAHSSDHTVHSSDHTARSSVRIVRSFGLDAQNAKSRTDRAGSIGPNYAMQSLDATSSASNSEPVG